MFELLLLVVAAHLNEVLLILGLDVLVVVVLGGDVAEQVGLRVRRRRRFLGGLCGMVVVLRSRLVLTVDVGRFLKGIYLISRA